MRHISVASRRITSVTGASQPRGPKGAVAVDIGVLRQAEFGSARPKSSGVSNRPSWRMWSGTACGQGCESSDSAPCRPRPKRWAAGRGEATSKRISAPISCRWPPPSPGRGERSIRIQPDEGREGGPHILQRHRMPRHAARRNRTRGRGDPPAPARVAHPAAVPIAIHHRDRFGQQPAIGADQHGLHRRVVEAQHVEAGIRGIEQVQKVAARPHRLHRPGHAVHQQDVAEELGHARQRADIVGGNSSATVPSPPGIGSSGKAAERMPIGGEGAVLG